MPKPRERVSEKNKGSEKIGEEIYAKKKEIRKADIGHKNNCG